MIKKIIYVLPRKPWPPYAGQAKLAYSRAKILKELGYETILIFISRNAKNILIENEKELLQAFNKVKFIDLSNLDIIYILFLSLPKTFFKSLPVRTQLIFSELIIRKFKKIIKKYNKNSFIHFYSASTFPLWKIIESQKIPFAIDLVDSATLNIKRKLNLKISLLNYLFWKFEYKLTKNFESNLPFFNFCRAYLSVSKEDLKFLKTEVKFKKSIPLINASVGVNLNNLTNIRAEKYYDVIFFGSLWYEPNINAVIWLINKVMKYVWRENKKIKLLIAGSNPSKAITNICFINKNISLIRNPKNMEKLIRSSKVSVAPMLSGSGQQNKIIEAMSLDIPVVTTSIAAKPLELVNKEHLLVADKPKDFANSILDLIINKNLSQELIKNSKSLIHEKYNWNKLVENLEKKVYK